MAVSERSREREIVLQRFLELDPREQLATYREIRDCLADRLTLVKRDVRVEERAQALEIFQRVADELGLAEGSAPSPDQFDAACRQLGVSWRFAKDAFLGNDHDSVKRRQLRTASGGRRRRYEAPRRSIELWLRSKPTDRTFRSYTAWAHDYNSNLKDGELPVTTAAHHVARKLGLSWQDAVAVVAGEIEPVAGRPIRRKAKQFICRGPFELVSMTEAAEILGCTTTWLAKLSTWQRFPTPVIDLPRGRLWIRQDIEAYGAERPFPRRERNEARHLYLVGAEVTELTGLTEAAFIRRPGFPEPAVRMGRVRLWLREEVVAWAEATKSDDS